MEYACGGGKTKLICVVSVPIHPIPIRWVVKLNVWSNGDEPNVRDGSPPPSPAYATTMDEACRRILNDGFLKRIL
jgi:hypothetical protein